MQRSLVVVYILGQLLLNYYRSYEKSCLGWNRFCKSLQDIWLIYYEIYISLSKASHQKFILFPFKWMAAHGISIWVGSSKPNYQKLTYRSNCALPLINNICRTLSIIECIHLWSWIQYKHLRTLPIEEKTEFNRHPFKILKFSSDENVNSWLSKLLVLPGSLL